MSALAPAGPARASAARHARRRGVDLAMSALLVLVTAALLALLALIVGYIVARGAAALTPAFFTQLPTPVGVPGGGVANALLGSLELVALASLLGLPLGILGAVYVVEFGDNPLARAVEFIADVLAGIPSIVMGVFAYTVVVLPMHRFSALAGGVALGLLMTPIILRTTAGILRLVPRALREGALALGATERATILRVVLPAARGGIVTGAMLAVARAAGETAPLLFTAFGNAHWQFAVDRPIAALPLQIFVYAISPYADWQAKAWAGSLVLVALVFLTSLLARLAARAGAAGQGR